MTTKDSNLNDGRKIYLNGKLLTHFDEYPVLKNTLKIIQQYYQLQENNTNHTYQENNCTYSTTYLTPKSVEDLKLKHQVYQEIAEKAMA